MIPSGLSSIRARVAYRIDRFLRLHGLVQVLIALLLTIGLMGCFAMLVALTGGAPGMRSGGDYLWWTLGRFSDGGTMYEDGGGRLRVIASIVTWAGIFLVQFMTGTVTAKLTDRLGQLRSGRSPVIEHGHVLVLGFDAKVPLIARELARTRDKHVLVVLAQHDNKDLEARLAVANRIPRNRLRIEVRVGDPQDGPNLLQVSADRAGAIVIVPPEELDDQQAFTWTFSTLLAVRRIAGPSFRGHVLVEARETLNEDLLRAAADGSPLDGNSAPLRLLVVAADDVMARVLSQSVRQEGVYLVLHELLSFRGAEVYFEPVPRVLAGRNFATVHAAITEGIAIGICRKDGGPLLNPPDDAVVHAADQLIILQEDTGAYCVSRPCLREPACDVAPSREADHGAPMHVVVLGATTALPRLVHELTCTLPRNSHVRIVAGKNDQVVTLPHGNALGSTCNGTRVDVEAMDPIEVASHPPEFLFEADAVVILGATGRSDAGADAAALETLVCLRHAQRRTGRRLNRLLTALGGLKGALHVSGTSDDLLVSTELIALLMTQLAVTPDLEPVLYRDILDAGGNDVFVRPRSLYVGEGDASFGQAMRGARMRGEVAIGIFRPLEVNVSPDPRLLLEGRSEGDTMSPVQLIPEREARVEPRDAIVVLARV
ncbi:MAG: hypothetical protein MUF54_20685 [Polyangiaceae bacterium]|jgi:hypothetical protein|nr:hypothetical protein [Polyangiaceae bacterium]